MSLSEYTQNANAPNAGFSRALGVASGMAARQLANVANEAISGAQQEATYMLNEYAQHAQAQARDAVHHYVSEAHAQAREMGHQAIIALRDSVVSAFDASDVPIPTTTSQSTPYTYPTPEHHTQSAYQGQQFMRLENNAARAVYAPIYRTGVEFTAESENPQFNRAPANLNNTLVRGNIKHKEPIREAQQRKTQPNTSPNLQVTLFGPHGPFGY